MQKLETKLFHKVQRSKIKMIDQVVTAYCDRRDAPTLAQKLGCIPCNCYLMNCNAIEYDDTQEINFLQRLTHYY